MAPAQVSHGLQVVDERGKVVGHVSHAEQEAHANMLGAYREAVYQARIALKMADIRMAEVALGRVEAMDTDTARSPYTEKAFEDAFNRICVVHRVKGAYLRVDLEPVLKKNNVLRSGGNVEVREALDMAVQSAPGVNAGKSKIISGEQSAAAIRALIQSKSMVQRR